MLEESFYCVTRFEREIQSKVILSETSFGFNKEYAS